MTITKRQFKEPKKMLTLLIRIINNNNNKNPRFFFFITLETDNYSHFGKNKLPGFGGRREEALLDFGLRHHHTY